MQKKKKKVASATCPIVLSTVVKKKGKGQKMS